MMKEEGLITEEVKEELLDALLNFWDYLRSRNDITDHEYSSYFFSTGIPPKESYIYSYELTDEEMPIWESIALPIVDEYRKYGSVDLRRESETFGVNIPSDTIRIIESKGFECPVGSLNFVMAYAVATTYVYILNKSDLDSRMDRLSKRILASEILPVFLAFWYFRKKN